MGLELLARSGRTCSRRRRGGRLSASERSLEEGPLSRGASLASDSRALAAKAGRLAGAGRQGWDSGQVRSRFKGGAAKANLAILWLTAS